MPEPEAVEAESPYRLPPAKRGARTARFTRQQLVQALRQARGIYTYAAVALEKMTGRAITRSGVKYYCDHNPELAELRKELMEEIIDIAEFGVISAANEGNVTASMFILKTQGRGRGWLERPTDRELVQLDEERIEADTEFTMPGPMTIEGEVEELEALSPEDLIRRYRAALGPDQ